MIKENYGNEYLKMQRMIFQHVYKNNNLEYKSSLRFKEAFSV